MTRLSPAARLRVTIAALLPLLAGCGTGRATAGEADRIAAVLQLGEGSIVADVGAGEGEWSAKLAQKIGRTGHLFATEVKADLVAEIEQRLSDASILNFTAIQGDQERSGLPEACCDAILLRMVYHHFEQPGVMRADLWRALRPGGLIALVDIVPQRHWRELDNVPDRGGHGIPIDDLVAEMIDSGFELVERLDDWSGDADRYCLVFRRPPSG